MKIARDRSLRLPALALRLPALALLSFGALLGGACVGEHASGGRADACTTDSECPEQKVCDEGQCVWWQAGPSGAGGGTSSSGSGQLAPTSVALCEEYVACLAAVAPQAVPEALAAYGPDGSCWSGGSELAATCGTACEQSMKEYHDVDAVLCPECHIDADCGSGLCDTGTCYQVLPVPDASPACTTCVAKAAIGACADAATQCAMEPLCLQTAECFATCTDPDSCSKACPDPYASTYIVYWACTMCVECVDVCEQVPWCQLG